MESNKVLQMLSSKSTLRDNYFHEACKVGSLTLLERAKEWMDQPMPSLLNERNYSGEQCTHIISKKEDDAIKMMKIVVKLGADVNGQESIGGFTPLHLCILEGNHELAEWLCKRPDINLEATNYAGQTLYQLALERGDSSFTDLLEEAGAKCEP